MRSPSTYLLSASLLCAAALSAAALSGCASPAAQRLSVKPHVDAALLQYCGDYPLLEQGGDPVENHIAVMAVANDCKRRQRHLSDSVRAWTGQVR